MPWKSIRTFLEKRHSKKKLLGPDINNKISFFQPENVFHNKALWPGQLGQKASPAAAHFPLYQEYSNILERRLFTPAETVLCWFRPLLRTGCGGSVKHLFGYELHLWEFLLLFSCCVQLLSGNNGHFGRGTVGYLCLVALWDGVSVETKLLRARLKRLLATGVEDLVFTKKPPAKIDWLLIPEGKKT